MLEEALSKELEDESEHTHTHTHILCVLECGHVTDDDTHDVSDEPEDI